MYLSRLLVKLINVGDCDEPPPHAADWELEGSRDDDDFLTRSMLEQ